MSKREPKTIQEVRTLVLAAVPNDTWLYVTAQWSDNCDGGAHYSRVIYRVSFRLPGSSEHVNVESHLPAQVARLAIAALIKAQGPLALPPARPRPAGKRRAVPRIKGSTQPRLTFG